MRYALALLLTFSSASLAQNSRPQMTWTGYVSGSATLYIQGNQVDVQGRETGAVDRPNAKFTSPLPASRTKVDMQVRRGRGKVEVVEQPAPDNQYAAIVQINPPGQRPEFYTLDFFWDTSDRRDRDRGRGEERGRATSSSLGEMRWSGEVDGEVLIELHGQRASSRAVRGAPVSTEQAQISGPISGASSNFRLEDTHGRGRVELVQRPSEQNSYTAIVRIQDMEGGRSPYSFRLLWDQSGAAQAGGQYSDSVYRGRSQEPPANAPGYLRWSGRVDGRVHVTVEGNRATVSTISGRAVADMNIDFHGGGGVPYGTPIQDLQVRKLRGRGEVRVVAAPDGNRTPGLVFEVIDDGGGSDFYEVEFTWR